MLHEIGHLGWNSLLTKEQKAGWKKVAAKNPQRVKQDTEELWCHCFANHFCNNKVVKHTHPEWEKFMEKYVKSAS